MTYRRRAVMDVSHLPTSVFGPRDILWWGTMGFVMIEGFTLVLCAVVYVYLTENFRKWPPEGTMLPSITVPTVQVLVMLLSLPLMLWVGRVSRKKLLRPVRLGLTMATAFSTTFCALRYWEITKSLNVRWDANAYGSAQWLILGAHASLLAVQLVEVAGVAAIFWIGPVEDKHFSDTADVAFYWLFIVLIWIPLYVLCFLVPHWIAR
jgi:cytochrome c oxidase subunit III